jgi:hypothetical protein
MADLRVTTLSGPDTVLKEAAVATFKQSLRGPLIAPGDDKYLDTSFRMKSKPLLLPSMRW